MSIAIFKIIATIIMFTLMLLPFISFYKKIYNRKSCKN